MEDEFEFIVDCYKGLHKMALLSITVLSLLLSNYIRMPSSGSELMLGVSHQLCLH